jgi:hypothetical protein
VLSHWLGAVQEGCSLSSNTIVDTKGNEAGGWQLAAF